jgi:hypothetical protein
MSKKENSGWFKSGPGMFGWLIALVIIMSWLPDSDDDKETKQVKTTTVQKIDVTDYQKDKFKSWTLNNLTVTDLSYPQGSDWQIWVTLTYDKYTSKENVESIAKKIARYYKLQTGYKDLVIVTVWQDGSVYAKGRSYP